MSCAHPADTHHPHTIPVNHGAGTVDVCTDHLGQVDEIPEVRG